MLSSRTGKAEGKCSSRSDPWGFTCVRAATECFDFERVRWAMGMPFVCAVLERVRLAMGSGLAWGVDGGMLADTLGSEGGVGCSNGLGLG